jgi:integrase
MVSNTEKNLQEADETQTEERIIHPTGQENRTSIQRDTRLESIENNFIESGLSKEATALLAKSTRKSTNDSYASSWRQFIQFCTKRGTEATKYHPPTAINFLASVSSQGLRKVLMLRTAISSTWKKLHPDKKPLGLDETCRNLIKAIKEANPIKNKPTEQWDIGRWFEHLKALDATSIEIRKLAGKTAALIALATFWRPKSDLQRIHLEDVQINGESLYLGSTLPKEGDYKSTVIYRYEDQRICPIKNLETYLERTKEQRESTTRLFITAKAPFKDASRDTIGKWISESIKDAGITPPTPHKLRSLSTTNAFQQGISLDKILSKANWSSATTFKNHYFKPSTKEPVRVHCVNEGHSRINEIELSKFIQECSSSQSELVSSQPTHRKESTDVFQKGWGIEKNFSLNQSLRLSEAETSSSSLCELEHS